MGNFCFFVDNARIRGHQAVEFDGLVVDGPINVGDYVIYNDCCESYKWRITYIAKGRYIVGNASAGENVTLGFSIAITNDIWFVDKLIQQVFVSADYDKPFITREIKVSCVDVSASLLKDAVITFKTDKLKVHGMILKVAEKTGKCYANIELIVPTYAKSGTKCVLEADNWSCEAIIE